MYFYVTLCKVTVYTIKFHIIVDFSCFYWSGLDENFLFS